MLAVAAIETNVQTPKLTAQTIGGRMKDGVAATEFSGVATGQVRRGRATSSPPQFGQAWRRLDAQAKQYVHSREQMNAAPSLDRTALHLSQRCFISKFIGSDLSAQRSTADAN